MGAPDCIRGSSASRSHWTGSSPSPRPGNRAALAPFTARDWEVAVPSMMVRPLLVTMRNRWM